MLDALLDWIPIGFAWGAAGMLALIVWVNSRKHG